MARITIDENDWEHMNRLVNQNTEDIRKLGQQIQPHSTDITSMPDSLTQLQSDIFRYISDHSHCNKADVERSLKDKGSKVTILKAIDTLVEYGLIRDEISKNNRQTHSLVVNNDNELSLLIRELDRFERAYFPLIDKLKEKFEDLENENKYSSFQKYGAFEDILLIYQFILNAYLVRGIYIWPIRISDDELLSKLYTILFTRLSQMQLELIKRSRIIFEQYDLAENMVLDSSTLPVSKDDLFESAKMFHYEKELDGLLTIVDSIGSEGKKAAFKNSRGRVNIGGRDRAAIRIGGRGNRAISQKVRPSKRKI
jgi:hypothetical protein